MEESNIEMFRRWVEAPVAKLRELPNGDGTFAVMSMAFGLYERFINSSLHKRGVKASPGNRYCESSKDFNGEVSADDFKAFWEMYRDGMQHYFHPKHFTKSKDNTRWGWDISENKGYKAHPEVQKHGNDDFIVAIDPWKFINHILNRWRENPDLLNELSRTTLGKIEEFQIDYSQNLSNSSDNHLHSTTSYSANDHPPAVHW